MTMTPASPRETSEDPATDRIHIPAQLAAPPAQAPQGAPEAPGPSVPGPRAAGDDTPAGLPVAPEGLYRPEPSGQVNMLAPWALLMGVVLPPLGVLLGMISLRRIRERSDDGRGLAIAGIVIGAVITFALVLVVVLSALVGMSSSSSSQPAVPTSPGGGSGASDGSVSQTCSGTVCTVTARGAPVTINGVGLGGSDGVSVLAVEDGSAVIASVDGPLRVPTGTALELEQGTEVVLTLASADTVMFVYQR